MIRTIFKKCRNITKKITDIDALAVRPDLKPEQVEKVRSKGGLVEERKKFEEFAKFYKTIISENAVENKGQINPDFTKISQLLVLSQFLAINPESTSAFSEPELKLVDSIEKDGKATETLAEKSLRLSQTIKSYMENVALVSKVEQLLSDPKFSSYTLQKNAEFAAFKPIETKEVKKEPVVVAPVKTEPVVVVPAPVEVPKVAEVKTVVAEVKPAPVVVQAPKEEKVSAPTPVVATPVVEKVVEAPVTAPVVAETPKEEVKPSTEAKTEGVAPAANSGEAKEEKQPFKKSENRPDRPYKKQYRERGDGENRGEYRGNYKGDYRAGEPREKGAYDRPRREDNNRNRPRAQSSSKSDTSL